jgi:SAM-dependent methyltransferase
MSGPNPFVKFLSHFFEWPVTELSSSYNEQLKVVLHRGRYKLITEGAIYSFGDLYSNFRKSFEQLKWKDYSIESCLIMGLGMGSIPDMLVSKFNKRMQFTAVEIDEAVTYLANTYVLAPKKINVQIFTADAGSFLEWHDGRYDMICSDVFVGDEIPESLQSIEAVTAMRDLLNPGGILLFNRLNRFPSDTTKNLKFLEDVFLLVFPKGGHIDVSGNCLLVIFRLSQNNLRSNPSWPLYWLFGWRLADKTTEIAPILSPDFIIFTEEDQRIFS